MGCNLKPLPPAPTTQEEWDSFIEKRAQQEFEVLVYVLRRDRKFLVERKTEIDLYGCDNRAVRKRTVELLREWLDPQGYSVRHQFLSCWLVVEPKCKRRK